MKPSKKAYIIIIHTLLQDNFHIAGIFETNSNSANELKPSAHVHISLSGKMCLDTQYEN